jgi:hypothetical protein
MRSYLNRLKYIAVLVLVPFVLFKAVQWWEGRGQGFRLYKIHSNLPYDSRWDIAYSDEDLALTKQVLSQPYHYLGHGFQCYAFESQDGKYVLKFFRHQRLRLPKFVLAMPSFPYFEEWRKSRILSLSRRLDYLLRSCKTSWDPARRETALLMVHLNSSKDIFPTVMIKDPLGAVHHVPLDACQFLLQKKAVLLKPMIARCMKQGDIEGAKKCLTWIFDLFIDCVHNDVQDTDGALIRKNNLGYLPEEGRAIYIDGGKLKKHVWKDKEFPKDLKRLYLLQKWLKEEYPSLVQPFEDAKENAIKRVEQFIASKNSVMPTESCLQAVVQAVHEEKAPCS